ncbi:MAG: hypothetical protein ACQKBV_07510 [Puniceicoccales bacterium]
MKSILAVVLFALPLLAGCSSGSVEGALASLGASAANPTSDPNSPEYHHRMENQRRITEAQNEYARNHRDPDAPVDVWPESY